MLKDTMSLPLAGVLCTRLIAWFIILIGVNTQMEGRAQHVHTPTHKPQTTTGFPLARLLHVNYITTGLFMQLVLAEIIALLVRIFPL